MIIDLREVPVLVSLFTDASFCHETQAAGWGYWARSERCRKWGGGPFKELINEVAEAELAAVANGMVASVRDGVTHRGDKVLIQCDNMQVVTALSTGFGVRTLQFNHILDTFKALRDRYELVTEVRHIKGHTKGPKAKSRHYVHNVADRIAKQHMNAERKRLREGRK